MSRDTIVAKRYAKALFEVAAERNEVARVEEDLGLVLRVIRDYPEYGKLLEHPNIDAKTKVNMLKQAFHGKVTDAVFNTLQLLVERRRESVLTELVNAYVKIANDALGQAKATVYTPFPLTEQEERDIAETFGRMVGKKIRVEPVIDRSLLGGLQVRIGDRLFDGSLSGKLERLQRALSQA
jgi:F-type H+-transporting ATPase subunit delta